MSPNESEGHQGHDDSTDEEPDWEAAARDALSQLLFRQRTSLEGALGTLDTKLSGVSDDTLTAEDIQEFRRQFYDVQALVENEIVPLIDGVEPYEKATMNLTAEKRADALNLRLEDIRDIPPKHSCESEGEDDGGE